MDIDYNDYMLFEHVQNSGRKIYIISVMLGFILSFITVYGFNANFISYLILFIIAAFIGIITQIKNYFFNDLGIGISYRILLISTMYYISINLTKIDWLSNQSYILHPTEWRFFYFTTPITLILYLIVGMLLSFPFKILSYAFGFLIDEFYIHNRKLQYRDFNIHAMVKDIGQIYGRYNESELQALQLKALREENYEEAQRIQKYLEEKFPD